MIPQDFFLTQNQAEVCCLLAHGFSIEAIAQIKGFNHSSVVRILRRVKKKLSVNSLSHLTFLLSSFEYISYDSVLSPALMEIKSQFYEQVNQNNKDKLQEVYKVDFRLGIDNLGVNLSSDSVTLSEDFVRIW